MYSFLLVSQDNQKRKEYIDTFARGHSISHFDIAYVEPHDASLGIADIRALQKTAYLAPGQGKEKMIVLEKAELLTTEAQNALLKILEEPPQNTYIMLSATSEGNFLPTITSRCKIITLGESREEVSEEKKLELTNQLEIVRHGTIGSRLALAEKLAADKENLPQWFAQSILLMRQQLFQNPNEKYLLELIQTLQSAYKDFQTTNVSPRMILEHAFLSFQTE